MIPLFSRVYCVDTHFSTGAENMEIDQRLMDAFLDGRFQQRFGANSCLWRFYGWQPWAITLGYNQKESDIDIARCRQAGIDVVRRPTGGRAVFHAEEFTYSFFAESSEPNHLLYRMVHEVIRHALEALGIHADFCRSTLSGSHGAPTGGAVSCFTASARYELQVQGRKLVGSAQRRTRSVLLQHGSLPLSGQHKELCRYIASSEEGAFDEIRSEMEKKTISLEEILGYLPPYHHLLELMLRSAGVTQGVAPVLLQAGELSDFFEVHEQSIH
jgi:lipoate-protein ligase A